MYKGGQYIPHHYFGKLKISIEGTGENIKIGKTKIGRKKYPVVKWTGKTKSVEYWECDTCYTR